MSEAGGGASEVEINASQAAGRHAAVAWTGQGRHWPAVLPSL